MTIAWLATDLINSWTRLTPPKLRVSVCCVLPDTMRTADVGSLTPIQVPLLGLTAERVAVNAKLVHFRCCRCDGLLAAQCHDPAKCADLHTWVEQLPQSKEERQWYWIVDGPL